MSAKDPQERIDEDGLAGLQAASEAAQEADALTARLAAMGVYNQQTAQDDAWIRALMLGQSKRGKTTALTLGCPKPLVLNCDGISATKGAAAQGAKFIAIDATDRDSWKDSCKIACKLAQEGIIQTIIVDTITLMQDSLIDDCMARGLEGRDLWGEVLQVLTKGIKLLKMAPAHLFVVAHQVPGANESEGIVPMLAGQAAQKIPALLHDTILFIYDSDRSHEFPAVQNRWFGLGPQDNWKYGSRNVRASCQIPADVPSLFAEFGVPL